MESGAVVAALGILVTLVASYLRRPSTVRAALVGVGCGVAVLARLDLAAVVPLVALAMMWRTRSLRQATWWLIGLASLVVPFAIWSLSTFGHLLPVSGSVKLDQVAATAQERYDGRFSPGYAQFVLDRAGGYLDALGRQINHGSARSLDALGPVGRHGILLLSLAGAGGALLRRRGVTSPQRWSPAAIALAVVGAMILAKAAIDLLLMPLWAQAWYSAPQRLAFGVLTGTLAAVAVRGLRVRPALQGAALLALLLLLLPGNASGVARAGQAEIAGDTWQGALEQASEWILADGPPGRYGAYDAGLLGWRLDGTHELVNLDGLVNDFAYADLLRLQSPPMSRYRHEGIDLLVGRFAPGDLRRPGCALVLWTSPQEVTYADGLFALEPIAVPVRVLDLRSCGASK